MDSTFENVEKHLKAKSSLPYHVSATLEILFITVVRLKGY